MLRNITTIAIKSSCRLVVLVKWQAKNLWNSFLIKWSDGEKEQDRQDEEAAVVAATQKRKMLCKTRRSNSVITVCRSVSLFLTAFAARELNHKKKTKQVNAACCV